MKALVIGGGLTGAVAAHELAEKGYSVLILERRDNVGGNMFDYHDEHGILVHKYGPHTFHTKDKTLFDYMQKFSKWEPYKLRCGAEINGICTPAPFNFSTVDSFYPPQKAALIKEHIAQSYPQRATITVLEALECEDELIKEYAQFLFDNDYSLYTSKQWGISPREIDKSVMARVPLRFSYDEGYFDDAYEVMPKDSYSTFFKNLLNHPSIEVRLGVNALESLSVSRDCNAVFFNGEKIDYPVIYTGAIDELFSCAESGLPYRSLKFVFKHEPKKSFQKYPVVAYPQAADFTRITEYNKLPVQDTDGTTYAVEYSVPYATSDSAEPYYPILTEKSRMQYENYAAMAARIPNLYCCGRLGDFKYYNMDQALKRALEVTGKIAL